MLRLFSKMGLIGFLFLAFGCQKNKTDRGTGAPTLSSEGNTTVGNPLPADIPGTPDPTVPVPRNFVYVGGGSNQINVYRFDGSDGSLTLVKSLALPGASPSFLAIHKTKPWLYAANESGSGGVMAFSINTENGELTRLNDIPAGGGGPTHVSIDLTGKYLMSANYGTGQVTTYPLQADGRLGSKLADLNAGLNAHQILSAPSGDAVFVPCLGSNYIAQYRLNTLTGLMTEQTPATLNVLTGGPRHMSFHPSKPWAYVLKELTSTIQALSFDAASSQLKTLGAAVSTRPLQNTSYNTGAEVQVHPNGNFVYASNRGDNSIAQLALNEDGTLVFKSVTPSGGSTPRHFSIAPNGKWLLAANQDSGTVNVLKLDPETGALTSTTQSVSFGSAQFAEMVDLNQFKAL